MNTLNADTDVDLLRSRASQQIRSNQLDAAQATLQALIRAAPDDVPACLELSDLMFRSGEYQASSRPLLQAAEHLPKNAPLLVHLVQHLIARGEIVTARMCLDFLAQAPNPPSELLVAEAHQRFTLGEIEVAKEHAERALASGADSPDDYHLYAMLLQFTGDVEKAEGVLEKALRRWPDFGDAMVALVNLRKQKPDTTFLEHIEKQLKTIPSHDGGATKKFIRAEFEYARFKTLDDLGCEDEAWSSLERCNALMHELNPYDIQAEDALINAFVESSDLFGEVESVKQRFEGPTPIFIVGMPRTGTTLLDRMLSSHSKVTTAGELIEFWRQLHWVADERPQKTQSLRKIVARNAEINFREVGERYLEHTQWRANGCAFYIDKLPANIQMVAFIRRALPHAPILHMVRAPMDVCFSNFKALFGNTSSYSYDLESMAHFYRGYSRLCAHWHASSPNCMLDVPYASLVSDPQSVMQKVLAYCGLDIEEACLYPERNMAPVATPSSVQVREPIHQRGVGQWQRYAKHLEPLREALSDLL
ncbi:tetratricopeptide repeat-containing sulfotransferase family protein [Oleiagrimonas sp. MCCC 1A03011]|uniref:tetratricopeptide repeat-containing sulfotransferase family protein n=1 Tax=Oleiagrimonas sp. MCCC 1A03011 TaxID=1926883 RepID=UPI000DC530D0|nr:tetratricopeptide repeat-containing sulfotransferase family protein [Oleiagrimonas sp. MCCC 1A03011]RAP59499.1 sulfotransferase family protein [Oleiagrimonas sp. MCCC 1A03011]